MNPRDYLLLVGIEPDAEVVSTDEDGNIAMYNLIDIMEGYEATNAAEAL